MAIRLFESVSLFFMCVCLFICTCLMFDNGGVLIKRCMNTYVGAKNGSLGQDAFVGTYINRCKRSLIFTDTP